MALDKNKLKTALVDNYSKLAQDDNATQSDSAEGMATAIIDFMKDAEIIPIGSPAFTPAAPAPIPDPTSLGFKLKVSGVDAAKAPLKAAIVGSFKAQDPTMTQITTGIVSATALMLNFGTPAHSAIGASVMVVPPIFAPSTAVGFGGGSIEDVCNSMATLIYASFLATIFTGTVIKPPAVIPGVISSTII
jgi:hypothetical protein